MVERPLIRNQTSVAPNFHTNVPPDSKFWRGGLLPGSKQPGNNPLILVTVLSTLKNSHLMLLANTHANPCVQKVALRVFIVSCVSAFFLFTRTYIMFKLTHPRTSVFSNKPSSNKCNLCWSSTIHTRDHFESTRRRVQVTAIASTVVPTMTLPSVDAWMTQTDQHSFVILS